SETVQTSRREFLWRFGGGLGGVALAHLLGQHGLLAEQGESRQVATSAGIRGLLRGGPHHPRSEEHTSELQSLRHLVCRLLLEKYVYHRDLHSFPTRRSSDLL